MSQEEIRVRGKRAPCSEETKQKIREAHQGKTLTPEHREKIGAGLRGKKQSKKAVQNRAASMRGKKWSEASRLQASLDRKGKPGKKWTEEQRRKMVELATGRPCPWVTLRKLPEEERLARRQATDRACRIKARYGITVEVYEKMLVEQGGVCAICKKTCSTGKRLAVDHDHDTGKVRGLLCRRCNRGLGHFRVEELELAVSYLKRC